MESALDYFFALFAAAFGYGLAGAIGALLGLKLATWVLGPILISSASKVSPSREWGAGEPRGGLNYPSSPAPPAPPKC